MAEPDWKRMCLAVVTSIFDALDELPFCDETDLSREYLSKGLRRAEEVYWEVERYQMGWLPPDIEKRKNRKP